MSVIPIDLAGAAGAKLICNTLVADPEDIDLEADLVLIGLPNGIAIDVSWHPENDASGAFFVTAFREGDWIHPLRKEQTRDPETAARLVEEFARTYSATPNSQEIRSVMADKSPLASP